MAILFPILSRRRVRVCAVPNPTSARFKKCAENLTKPYTNRRTAHATLDTVTAMITNSQTRINEFFQPLNDPQFAAQQLNAFAALDEDAEEKAAAAAREKA